MEGKRRKKELWTAEENRILTDYITVHGKGRWNRIPKTTGLKREGKSCRLRWMKHLCPSVKHGNFTQEEEDLIIRLQSLLENWWSLIAGRMLGRTDSQVKNYWNTHLSKKLRIMRNKVNAGAPSPKACEETDLAFKVKDSTAGMTSSGGPPVKEDQEKDAVIVTQFYEQIIGEWYGCRYWSCNDSVDVNTPSLLELTGGYYLDFAWNQ